MEQNRVRTRFSGGRRLTTEALETRWALSAANSATLTMSIEGQLVAIPANIGVQANNDRADVFTLTAGGVLCFDPADAPTLGEFFDIWRANAGLAGNNAAAELSDQSLMGNRIDGDSALQMFVNGQVVDAFDDYVLRNGDQIALAYGANPVVSINTNFGSVVVELFAARTPITVANFLNYVTDGDYVNSIFHRRPAQTFVIQGGGFVTPSPTFTNVSQFTRVPTDATIQNEPGIPNTRGTVAMAKLGGNPNSATSQFFVNLADNRSILDGQNGGFTVFGQALGMAAVDALAAIPIHQAEPGNVNSAYNELPYNAANQLIVVQGTAGLGAFNGVKFSDANGNGVRDQGEVGLGGVAVYLDANGNGRKDPAEVSTVTDANGRYRLLARPGSHTLRAESVSGGTPTNVQSFSGVSEIGGEISVTAFGERVVVTAGSGVLSGVVYIDHNGNGAQDAGEDGVPGVQVALTGVTSAGTTIASQSIISQNDGSYRFTSLSEGTYRVIQTQPTAIAAGIAANEHASIVLNAASPSAERRFAEGALLPQYSSISLYFASSARVASYFRQVIAEAEAAVGNIDLANAIRAGSGSDANASSQSVLSHNVAVDLALEDVGNGQRPLNDVHAAESAVVGRGLEEPDYPIAAALAVEQFAERDATATRLDTEEEKIADEQLDRVDDQTAHRPINHASIDLEKSQQVERPTLDDAASELAWETSEPIMSQTLL